MKKPWPTKDAMEQVYDQHLWGKNETPFYSGEGSHDAALVSPYIDAITTFLKSFDSKLTVCDLGCGDFNVGKEFVQLTKKYNAIDIVPDLIRYNERTFKAENLEFLCLDIAVDDLPTGDCALIRQVLQHVSNAEILQIIPKLAHFNYVIVTEHLPVGDFEPNKDIISGQGIRLKKRSGVNLLAPPFNLIVQEEQQLHVLKLSDEKGIIVTTMYRMS